ncbi:hypothetical protein BH09VER1_BH09VER1_22240 [soil metagenome]
MKDQTPDIVDDLHWILPTKELLINPWMLAGGILVLLLTAALLIWLIRRKKKTGTIFTPPAPHEKALKALRGLASMISEENDLVFIIRVSQIVREYIQERFALRAPHRSTEEFLSEARSSNLLASEHQELLRVFLAQCDLVKFAQHRAVVGQMKELHQSAQRFVEGTIPAPPASQPKKNLYP